MFSSFSVPRKGIQDSLGFEIPPSGFLIPWYWIPIFVNGTWIWDSLNCILDSKTQDSRFHKQIFPDSGFHKQKLREFRNPDSLGGDIFFINQIEVLEYLSELSSRVFFVLESIARRKLYGYKKSLIRLYLEMHASLPGLLSWNNVMA